MLLDTGLQKQRYELTGLYADSCVAMFGVNQY